jgi:hypothetical protein
MAYARSPAFTTCSGCRRSEETLIKPRGSSVKPCALRGFRFFSTHNQSFPKGIVAEDLGVAEELADACATVAHVLYQGIALAMP